MFERFTEGARQVVVLAQDEARAFKHDYIGTEHLLLGVLRDGESLGARVLSALGVETEDVRAQVARIVGFGDEAAVGQIPFTPRGKRVLELSLREALGLGDNYIGTEHILLGLARVEDGVASRILRDLAIGADRIRDEVIRLRTGGRPAPAPVPSPVMWAAEASRWEYAVRMLEGAPETWAEQLTAWRREGWELLTIAAVEGEQHAVLERRAR